MENSSLSVVCCAAYHSGKQNISAALAEKALSSSILIGWCTLYKTEVAPARYQGDIQEETISMGNLSQ
ncbi:MAG: hypothetical protein K8R91_01400 [Phycisphaerae bacterium]|nr:hypothetical protein [Phycisphaerae bacterium]